MRRLGQVQVRVQIDDTRIHSIEWNPHKSRPLQGIARCAMSSVGAAEQLLIKSSNGQHVLKLPSCGLRKEEESASVV